MTSYYKKQKQKSQDQVDEIFDIPLVKDGPERLGFLANFKTSSIQDENLNERTVFLGYFIEQSGDWFKCMINMDPYFYVACDPQNSDQLITYLQKKFEKKITQIEKQQKMNLEQINHLSGKEQEFIKLSFLNIQDLLTIRQAIKTSYEANQKKKKMNISDNEFLYGKKETKINDMLDVITDMREYDVPYHIRVCIDKDVRASFWYRINFSNGFVDEIQQMSEITERPELKYLAYDIETSKQPSKFPDATIDCIMMISLMYEGEAFLITNRAYCGQDVEGFEYAPKPDFECQITVYNEPTEKALLQKFFNIIKDYKPLIITTFNGDFFDFPFLKTRADENNLSLEQETGIYKEDEDQFIGRFITHLDCYYWVQRDAYLPQGSHGLKAVTRAKLGYDPIECDPELMCYYAINQTQVLAEYSISDAVATYFLYKKHIHDFIFALCTIIPMYSDEVLRKGSGTLCENLLMACAYQRNIIFPNKQKQVSEKFYQGHLLDSETYIGGKVECLRSGVYRSDFLEKFQYQRSSYQSLIDNVDDLMEFILRVECQRKKTEVKNFEKVRENIIKKLTDLRDVPNPDNFETNPLIYHLDVAAMYPNIILTNRLQPVAIVNNKICSGCLYNTPESDCKRNLQWQWRGEYFPLQRREYEEIKFRLEQEMLSGQNDQSLTFVQKQQNTEAFQKKLAQRVKQYSQKTYKKIHVTQQSLMEDTVCMRENSFYIDTIRNFRDRRYEFKHLVKKYKGIMDNHKSEGNLAKAKEASDLMALYESLQLAHKIILNSFYGYVMRKGARWYSMEMAAMVTHIGSQIISDAKVFVDKVGKPLELDTDGIWGLLPAGFPEGFFLEFTDGKKYKIEYPCSVLNHITYEKYCNKQYQEYKEDIQDFEKRTEMSIFFELDGPYKAMIIPAAKEEGKMLKKRYAVFTHSGKLAELKGFELKRRGELNIIKIFQDEIFKQFLKGTTLRECYEACSVVAKKWLRLLTDRGVGLDDEELIHYIGESKMLSKDINEYGEQKGVGLTAARRMGEFLGKDIIKGKGLNTNYIISKKPEGTSITQRAVPISIFSMDKEIKVRYLKKWLKDSSIKLDVNIKDVLDWEYYIDRLSGNIQKIITIPAALQGIKDLIPSVPYPDWLHKILRQQEDRFKQVKIRNYFSVQEKLLQNSQKPSVSKDLMQIESQQGPTKQEILEEKKRKEQEAQIQKEKERKKREEEKLRRKNKYSLETEFSSWLKEQKQIWIDQRSILKNRGNLNNPQRALKTLFKDSEEMILNSNWQILQISPTNNLGIYKLWIYTDSVQLVSVYVQIDRVIYINSLQEKKDIQSAKLVKKKLPREKQASYLYEITLTEEEYNNTYMNFDLYSTNPNYEGIYETEIPLIMKFITQIGNNAKINKQAYRAQGKQLYQNTQLFNIDVIQGHFMPDKAYLSNVNFSYFVVYQLQMKGNEIWGIFNHFSNQYRFIKVHKNKDNQNFNLEIKKILKEKFEMNANTNIQVFNMSSNQDALFYIDKYIQEQKEIYKTNILAIFHSVYNLDGLRSYGVKQNIPIMCLNNIKIDSSEFNSLNWQLNGIKFLCNNYLNFPEYLQQLIELCNYAQIPLCNVGENKDHFNYITNIIYSRALRNSNLISWYQDYSILNKKIDNTLLIPYDYMESEHVSPGLYWSYCVEIDISLLALNTIALSDILKNEFKEISLLIEVKNQKQQGNYHNNKQKKLEEQNDDNIDEISAAKTSFRILKLMVLAWLEEVEKYQNPIADACLANIHRWIVSEDNSFYDPMLDRMLNKLNKLVFGALMKKLKELGAKIIFANMEKVIINTSKYTKHEASNYTKYILDTVTQEEDIFRYIGLSEAKYHQILLFKDQFNFLGISIDENQQYEISDNWNIIEFLPYKLQQMFKIFIIQYICDIYGEATLYDIDFDSNEYKELCKKYIEGKYSTQFYEFIPQLQREHRKYILEQENKKKIEEGLIDPVENQFIEEEKEESNDDYYSEEDPEEDYEDLDSFVVDDDLDNQQQIQPQKKKKNKKQIQKEKEIEDEKSKQWEIPQKLGSLSKIEQPVLEFVKFIVHVLEFDEPIKENLVIFKRNCLKFLEISDFSVQAEYTEPCLVLKLNDIICKNCQHISNLDLCRDEWKCKVCQETYDLYYIQYRVIEYLKNNLTYQQIQDMYCVKCKMVRSDQLMHRCKCSGKYEFQVDKYSNPLLFQHKQIIQNLQFLGTTHKFRMLNEYLQLYNI